MGKTLVYQVLPRLWKGGKFVSFDEASLAYVRSLGMTHVWYTGVIDHATRLPGYENASADCVKGTAGSPYSIRDYYAVAPYLGTMEDFEDLVARTHAAGLKVLIDFVPNHVARENVNFGRSDDRSVHWAPENDFYYYPGEALRLPLAAGGQNGGPAHTDGGNFGLGGQNGGPAHTDGGNFGAGGQNGGPAHTDGGFEGGYREFPARASGNCFSPAPDVNDWWDTVRLNYCDFHTGTWDKMLDILRFWLSKGVDGFRCDMVEMVPWQFLQWLIASVKAQFPDALFIAEAYNTQTYRHYLETVGFDLLYDKCGLYDTLRAVTCNGASARGITRNWQMLGDLQTRMLNFLENHDEQRVASAQFAGSPEAGYAALAVSALLTDAPFMLYFGEESGEPGGADGRTSIFEIDPPFSHATLRRDVGLRAKTAQNARNPREPWRVACVLPRYRDVLALAGEVAGSPTYDLCWCQGEGFDPDRHFAWLRGVPEEMAGQGDRSVIPGLTGNLSRPLLLVANFSPEPADITVRIPAEALLFVGGGGNGPGRDDHLVISSGGEAGVEKSVRVPGRDFVAVRL